MNELEQNALFHNILNVVFEEVFNKPVNIHQHVGFC